MIDSGCKETLCVSCSHREICFFKDEFLKAQTAVDNLQICRKSAEDAATCMVSLRNVPWLKPVELVCVHYVKVILQRKEPLR